MDVPYQQLGGPVGGGSTSHMNSRLPPWSTHGQPLALRGTRRCVRHPAPALHRFPDRLAIQPPGSLSAPGRFPGTLSTHAAPSVAGHAEASVGETTFPRIWDCTPRLIDRIQPLGHRADSAGVAGSTWTADPAQTEPRTGTTCRQLTGTVAPAYWWPEDHAEEALFRRSIHASVNKRFLQDIRNTDLAPTASWAGFTLLPVAQVAPAANWTPQFARAGALSLRRSGS